MRRLSAAALLVAFLGCASGAGSSAPPTSTALVPGVEATGSGGATATSSTDGPPAGAALARGSSPAPAPPETVVGADGPPSALRPPFQMRELSEKDWLRGVRDRLAERLKVPAEDIFFSPSKQTAALLRRLDQRVSSKRRGPSPPRRYRIEVVDHQGKQRSSFRPISARGSDEPPKDLRFLAEDRLVYEVVTPPPPPPAPPGIRPRTNRTGRRGKALRAVRRPTAERSARRDEEGKASPVAEGPPPRLFIIQPIKRRARPTRCEGTGFDFVRTPLEERIAFVAGRPGAAFVSVNGVQVYPRKGRSAIASHPTWSKDGIALAFLEAPAGAPARLILLAEFDNPSGDTTWPLPASARLDGARVFWAGPGKLVVGRTALKPLFATSFVRERPREFSP